MEDVKKTVARIEDKLDRITDELSQIKIVQVEQAKDIKHHIARTDASEARIEMVEEKLLPLVEIKTRFDGIFVLFGKVTSALTLIFGAIKALEVLLEFLK